MAAMQNLDRDQKVRFLASDILFKGTPQTLEDVCTDCRLFPVTPAELLEFTVLPVKFLNCFATALCEPFPGSIFVTPAFCQEIGRRLVVTPFSLSQYQGGNWSRNIASVTPPLPDCGTSKTPSRPVIGESTRSQVPLVDGSLLSTPPVGGFHVSECPSGTEPAPTHAGITDMKGCVQSNASYLLMGGSTLSQTQRADKTTALLSFLHQLSTESARCPSNCQSVPSQGPTKDGVVCQGDELGYHELLQRQVNATPSTRGVRKGNEVSPALGPVSAGTGSVLRRSPRLKAAQKLVLRGESREEEECGAAHSSGLSSRVIPSATGNLRGGERETPEKKRGRVPHYNVVDKGTSVKRKRSLQQGLMAPVALKEDVMVGIFSSGVHPCIDSVRRPELGRLEHSEVLCGKRISVSGTGKSGVAEMENTVEVNVLKTEEAGSTRGPKKNCSKALSCTPKSTRKACAMPSGEKAVKSNPSLVVSLSTLGLTCSQLVHGPGPVVGGAVHLKVMGETRVSSSCGEKSAGKELDHRENCSKPEHEFAGKFYQSPTSPGLYDGKDTVTHRNENSPTFEKSAGSERAHLLYVSDSEENSSTAELPQAPMLTSSSGAHGGLPKLPEKLRSAENKCLDTETMQQQAVHRNDMYALEVEEAIGPKVASRAGFREHIICINNMLREMGVIITSSAVEHTEGPNASGLSSFDEQILKTTVPEVQLTATFPRPALVEGARGDISGSGYSLTANEKLPVGQMEDCVESHVSMDSENLHYDGDDFAALAHESQDEQMEHYQAIRNIEGVTAMCVEPGMEITERNAHLHTGASDYGLNTRGETPGAGEERPHSRCYLPKYVYQPLGVSRPAKRIKDVEENEVRGEEHGTSLSLLEKPLLVHLDHAVVPGVCGGLATDEVILESNRIINESLVHDAPTLEAKRSLGAKYPESGCAMDFVGFNTVSESAVNRVGTHEGAYSSTGQDLCCRKVVYDVDRLKVLSIIESPPVVSAVPQKEATSSVFATRDERQGIASPHKPAVDAKLRHVRGHQKKGLPELKEEVRFVPIKRSQVGVEEGTHVRQKTGKGLESGHLGGKSENGGKMRSIEDAVLVQVENSEKHFSQQIVKEKGIGYLGSTGNYHPADKTPLALESGSLNHVTINDTRDRNADSTHPGNEAGTELRRNTGEHIRRDLIAVHETVVPANVKLIDTVTKQKNQEFKIVPEFDDYTVIAEEGSGGYGTVYRVMNNATKRIYAMKCPLLKTHSSCVKNEIRMLKQLGGKECIIKFKKVVQGRIRTVSDSAEKVSECESILLDFMEHDKPEILKKEITIEELRNYSVCLFRALAHMHRLSIMHLDVKPGNFLFSRSKKRGYLVDFNLARDEPKQPKRMKKVLSSSSHISSRIDSSRRSSKRPPVQDVLSTPVSYSKRSRLLMGASGTKLSYGTPSPAKAVPVLQDQSNKFTFPGASADVKVSSPRLPDLAPSRSTTTMGALSSPWRNAESPKPESQHGDPEGARQLCDGSADVQKNQTLGPRPQSGHRALLKYIQTKVYNEQPPIFTQMKSSLPASQRKRVAAVQNKRKAVTAGSVPVTQQTSQPLFARKLKAPGKPKGCNDQVKDGACVGTKGYRAPEVLLRSLKQTTKVDMWSAGVSLLQLVSGRSPFTSTSTEGALKDIAKIRGSDKILALATRHQRQHSISKELCAMRSSPMSITEWCEKHSKRPDLKGRIPPELFDLLEKCLDVDPASRITAEEALNHHFCSSLNEGS